MQINEDTSIDLLCGWYCGWVALSLGNGTWVSVYLDEGAGIACVVFFVMPAWFLFQPHVLYWWWRLQWQNTVLEIYWNSPKILKKHCTDLHYYRDTGHSPLKVFCASWRLSLWHLTGTIARSHSTLHYKHETWLNIEIAPQYRQL